MKCLTRLTLVPCLAAAAVLSLPAQTPASKPPVPYSAYDGWNRISGTALSRDGHWLAYALIPEDGDGELVVRNLASGAEQREPRGENPKFTADGRFVVFTIAPTKAERDKAKKAGARGGSGGGAEGGGPSGGDVYTDQAARGRGAAGGANAPKSGMGILNLASGAVFTVDRVKSFQLAAEGSTEVAYLMEAPARPAGRGAAAPTPEPTAESPAAAPSKREETGTDLIIRDLGSGDAATIPDVLEYAWAENGANLAYTVGSKTAASNGVYVWSAAAGLHTAAHALLTGAGHYKQLAWVKSGVSLAFVSDHATADANPPHYELYQAAPSGAAAMIADNGLPADMWVSEYGKVNYSDDGARLFFGIAAPPKPTPKDPPTITHVDLWSWTDAELQPVQQIRATEEAHATFRTVVPATGGAMVALASPDMPTVALTPDDAHALGSSDVPYRVAESWDGSHRDYYAVNMENGARRKLLTKIRYFGGFSPNGQWATYFDPTAAAWFSVRVADGVKFNLTGKLPVPFRQEEWDQPGPAGDYGAAGWTANDADVLLYDRYDIWAIHPDGTHARNLTAGAGRLHRVIYRYQQLDPDAHVVASTEPLLLNGTNEHTRATGFYRVPALSAGGGAPQPLLVRDARLAAPVKAKDADTLVFTESRFDEFPDLWLSGSSFAAPRKISDANPQQAQYRWGKAELISYVNATGKPLQGVLIKPEGFDPAKKYPLIVYIYERLSDTLHTYHPPAPGTTINLTRYVSHGYLVLEPDIAYTTGNPGQNALDCVLPAIAKVESLGIVDPKRVGIEGHSWGGYQIAYMVTRTSQFRAVEAGAAVADMVSAYGGIRWGTGISREVQYEEGQSRLGGTPWDMPETYLRNSAIFHVENVRTPYLTIQNDGDTAVPWYQGIEFFTALRRLHKPAWMFNFNGEAHGLQQRDNQKYWTVAMDEYFDYYLNGAPEPGWMKTGVAYADRGERDMTAYFEPKPPAAVAAPSGGHHP